MIENTLSILHDLMAQRDEIDRRLLNFAAVLFSNKKKSKRHAAGVGSTVTPSAPVPPLLGMK